MLRPEKERGDKVCVKYISIAYALQIEHMFTLLRTHNRAVMRFHMRHSEVQMLHYENTMYLLFMHVLSLRGVSAV